MTKKWFFAAIPIVMGVASAILWRALVPGSLSIEVYRWVYSTIVQAYAAMVAVVGMFTIYRLEFLRHTVETEAERLKGAVVGLNQMYRGDHAKVVPEEGFTVSDDFVGNEKAYQNLGEQICRGTKTLFDLRKKIEKRAKTVPSESKQNNKEKLEYIHLGKIQKALNPVNERYRKIEKAKKSVMRITKAVKAPLVISGLLIGTSLFLLSLSDKAFISTASSVFLWLLAGVIGTAVYLTYLLIKEILVLVGA